MKPPCKDCSERKVGCAVSCEKWRDYAAERDKGYAERVWDSEYEGYKHKNIAKVKHRLYREKKR